MHFHYHMQSHYEWLEITHSCRDILVILHSTENLHTSNSRCKPFSYKELSWELGWRLHAFYKKLRDGIRLPVSSKLLKVGAALRKPYNVWRRQRKRDQHQWRSRRGWGSAVPKDPKCLTEFWGPKSLRQKIFLRKIAFKSFILEHQNSKFASTMVNIF